MNRILLWIMFFCMLTFHENSAQKSAIETGAKSKRIAAKSSLEIIDSLKNEITFAKNEKIKSEIYLKIGENFTTISIDSSMIYFNNSLSIGMENEWDEVIANSYLQLGIANFRNRKSDLSKEQIEKSLSYFEKIKNEVGIGKCYWSLGNYYLSELNYEQGENYYIKALEFARKNKQKKLETSILRNYATLLKKQNNLDSAITVLKESISISKEVNNYTELISAYIDLGIVYSDISEYKVSIDFAEQALEIAEKIGDLDKQARILNNIAVNYDILSEYQSALEYYSKSLAISEKLNNKRSIALKLGNIGAVYVSLSDYKKALDYLEMSIKTSEKLQDKNLMQNNYGNLGILYEKMEKYDSALEYYLKSKEMSEFIDDKMALANVFGNIGVIYYKKNEYNHAIENLNKAIDYSTQIGHKLSMATNYLSLGNVYQKINNSDKALNYFQKSLEISENIGALRNAALANAALGTQYFILSKESLNDSSSFNSTQLNKAIEYLEKSSNSFRSRNELDDLRQALETLSSSYSKKGNFKKGLEYYKETSKLKDSIYNIDTKKKISELEAVKNLELKQKENELLINEALLQESELSRRNQELLNLSNIRKIQQLEIEQQQFDIEKKDKELTILNNEKIIQDLELKQKEVETQKNSKDIQLLRNRIDYQTLVRNFMIVSIILISILAIVLFVFFKRKKRDNQLLEEKNQQIENANIELERLNEDLVQHQDELTIANTTLKKQRIELQKYSESLESIVSERTQELVEAMKEIEKSSKLKTEIIANMNHEIRTPLSFIKSASAYIKMLIPTDNSNDELIDTIDSLNQGVNRFNKTMELFADLSSLKSGNFIPRIEPINLKSILDHHYLIYKKEISEQGKPIELNFSSSIDDVYIQGDENCILSSLGFIIDNAVKFTNSGFVNICLSYDNNCSYIVSIEDSGIGISDEYKSKIFEPFSQEDMSATRKHEGIGLSLALAHEYSLLNNFKINFISEQGKGTTFILSFKKCDVDV